jgi:hypothetical protein
MIGRGEFRLAGLLIIVVGLLTVAAAVLAQPTGQNSSTPPLSSGYPPGGTPVTGVGAGTTGAVTGSLAATAGKTNYLCSFDISAIGGTATVGPVTLTGLLGGNTLTYQLASTAAGNFLSRTFSPCVPASAINTAISVVTTADGTASAVDVNLVGFQQ